MPDAGVPVLVALTGLPGSGKTTVARELAARLGAVHVRVDVIETALETSGVIDAAGGWEAFPAAGYAVAYALAADHLRAGTSVVADTVNPISITREAWRGVAHDTGTRILEVEVVCSDEAEHRRRVEAREADIPGHAEPTWEDIVEREYEPLALGSDALRVDTAHGTGAGIAAIVAAIGER